MSRDKIDKQMIETVATLVEKFEHLMTNHLPHMQLRMDSIEKKLDTAGWYVITTLVGIVLSLLGILATLLFK